MVKTQIEYIFFIVLSCTLVRAKRMIEHTPAGKGICQYGAFCRTDADCVLGNKCIIHSIYYSQCIPDTCSYSDVSTGCVVQYSPCNSTSTCCDPGAICASYNLCVQPQTPTCVYPNGFSSQGEAAQTAADIPLTAGVDLIKNLPELLLKASPQFKPPKATDPSSQVGSGSPATVDKENLPHAVGSQSRKSHFRTNSFGGSFFADFKASDSGNVNAGYYAMPPDNNVCAGNNQVVLLVNRAMRVYSTSGAILKTVSLGALFGNPSGSLFDPVCRYDSMSSRWIIVVGFYQTDSLGKLILSGMYVLTTQTADITGGYWYYYLEMRNYCANGQCLADFPTLGQDKYGVWLSINKFANSGGFVGSIVFGLRKATIYSKGTITPCVFDNVKFFTYSPFTIQPASDLGTSGVDGTEYLLSNYNANSVWKGTITGTANVGVTCANLLLTQTLVSGLQTMSIPPASATQKNGVKVVVDDGRMNQVILSASTLYFTRAVATGSSTTSGVAYFAIDKTSNAVKKQGILGFAGWSVWNGAIVVNAAGNGVIASTVLPPTTISTISSMYSQFTLAGGAIGSTYYPNTYNLCGFTSPLRTGDYSGAAINTDGVAYVVSMMASSDICPSKPTNWLSTITKVVLV